MLKQQYDFVTFLFVRFFTGLFAGCNPIFKAESIAKEKLWNMFGWTPGLWYGLGGVSDRRT